MQLVSVRLRHGPSVLNTMVQGLATWMSEHGYAHIDEFRGLLNLRGCRDSSAFERANYIRTLQSWRSERHEQSGSGVKGLACWNAAFFLPYKMR